jgi:hypothetical protein
MLKPKRPVHTQKSLDELLTVVARPVAAVRGSEPEVTPKSKRRSRFFFKLPEDEMRELKALNAPKTVELDNAEFIAYAEALAVSLPPNVKLNLEKVRDFFIQEIAPLTLALSAGAEQAKAAIKVVTGSEVEPSTFQKFEKMAHLAVQLRMASFLEDYLALGAGSAVKLLPEPAHAPKPLAPPTGEDDSPTSGLRKDAKELRRTMQRILDVQSQTLKGSTNGPIEG